MRNSNSGSFFCLVLFLLACNAGLNAQRAAGTWKEYKSYHEAIAVVETATKVFAVYDGGIVDSTQYVSDGLRYGSLMSYTPEDQSVKLYSKSDGLSDVGISFINYSSDAGALALVYGRNSNIDILTGSGFTNITSLKNNANFQNKTVNNLEIDGVLAYLSTAFGIVVLDLKKLEVKATYPLNKNIRSVCRYGQYLYAAGEDGVLRGLLTANLADKNNWEEYIVNSDDIDMKITKLLVYENSMVYYIPGAGVYYKEADGRTHLIQNGVFRQLTVNHDQLILTGQGYISFFSGLSSGEKTLSINANGVGSFNDKTIYWIAAGLNGLMSIKKDINSSEYTVNTAGIGINSPRRDLAYYLTFSQNKLLVVGGSRGSAVARSFYPGTLMVYEKGSWFNFDEKEIENKTGMRCWDFTSAVVDPRDPNHYFASSWGEGLYEFKNNEFVQRYTKGNSSLDWATLNALNSIRVDGLVYDKENNLYMNNPESYNCFDALSSGGEWSGIFYENMSGNLVLPQQIVIDKNNRKWVNIPRQIRRGVFVFDDKSQSPFAYYSSQFSDQQQNNVNATGYFCVAEDLSGTIWVGTDNGPIFFSSPNQVAQGRCNRVVITGNSSEPYYLLYGEKVTTIAVDGGNRKWFGTERSGVFCVDINGDNIQVTNFTTENSMLISDVINSIAIDNNTGEIFIGTDKGIVSYMNDATAGKPDYSKVYAFPNPVRPATDNRVVITGLMANSTVKITDLNGNLITQGTSLGGQFTWNCTKRNGQRVTSGIYLVLASTPEGKEGVATKIMVIK
ncbi:MAG: hypothetical protein LBJ72_06695 [Dysgonamonadaceae bacterium]|jgi:hypothetical protein|nr:hypothetical protein [Dysgonamonadaceae bacterium]